MAKKGINAIAAGGSNMPSLYMCFQVYEKIESPRWMVQSINLTDLITSSSSSNPNPMIRQVLHTTPDLKIPCNAGCCCVSRSKIMFGGGYQYLDPRDHGRLYDVSDQIYEFDETDELKISDKKFSKGKSRTMMMTLRDGKLYALGFPQPNRTLDLHHKYLPPFEVFDFKEQTWSILPDPPFDDLVGSPSSFNLCYATVDTTILLSAENSCTYRFDAACPSKGWKVHTASPLPCSIGRALVLNHCSDYNIMFGYDSCYDAAQDIRNFTIGVHLMDTNDYSWTHISSLLVLPPEILARNPTSDTDIVHISCAVVTFEYFLSSYSKTIKFNILGFRLLNFDDKPPCGASMLGAFLVGDPVQYGNAFTDYGGKFPKATKGITLEPGETLPDFLFERATTSAVATMASVGCIPNQSSLVPIAASQQNHFPSCSRGPVSVLPCADFLTGNCGNSYQYSQQHAGHYPIVTEPGIMYPNTHAMVGHMQSSVPNLVQVAPGYVYPKLSC
ncbi:hypothetical protein ACLB2K_009479 [Fragaria x ananassa]